MKGNQIRKIVLSICMLALVSSCASAGGKSEKKLKSSSQIDTKKNAVPVSDQSTPSFSAIPSIWETVSEGESVEVCGKIRRVGNEPFSFLVITDSADKDWYTDEAGAVLLKSLEQKPVCVRGIVTLKEMKLANGKSLGIRRILTGISIVK